MLNRIRFAFAAGLFLTPSFVAKAEVLDTITDAPSSIFQFFRGVSPRMLRNKAPC